MGGRTSTTYPDNSETTIDNDPSGSFPTGSTAVKVTFESGEGRTWGHTIFGGAVIVVRFAPNSVVKQKTGNTAVPG